MKEKILNSSKYKRYKYYLFIYLAIYALALVFSISGVFYLAMQSGGVTPIMYAIPFIWFSLLLLPFIGFYGINMLVMIKNVNNYELVTGIITSIYTTEYVRSDSRKLTIEVSELGQTFEAKVYKGDLYDEVAKNVKVELAYNKKKEEVIVLGVL